MIDIPEVSLLSGKYITKKLRGVLLRQGHDVPDYSAYDEYIDFNVPFKICLFPDLLEQLDMVHKLYDSYIKKHDNMHIEDNFYSNKIEGADLESIYETLCIAISSSYKDEKSRMVTSYNYATIEVDKTKHWPIDVHYCDFVHVSLMSLLYNDKTGRRDNSVWIGNDQFRFTPCDCQLIEPSLNLLFSDWLDSYDIFIRAAIIHFLFVWVHPYFDGNGRTIRILHKELLIRNGLIKFEGICIDKCIYESRSKYYRAIRDSEEDYDITHFILYMLDVYEKCLSEGVE